MKRKKILFLGGEPLITNKHLSVLKLHPNPAECNIIYNTNASYIPTLECKDEWTKLFKKTFKFVGGEIVNEFLMSTGYLPGAHDEDCSVFIKIKTLQPKWMEK